MEETVILKLTPTTCCECGILFGISSERKIRLEKTGESFYCTNGHSQYFTKKKGLEDKIRLLKNENKSLECRIDVCKEKPIWDIFQYRFCNVLENEGIENIGQIIELGEHGLRNIFGIGDVAIDEINSYLNNRGLKLA